MKYSTFEKFENAFYCVVIIAVILFAGFKLLGQPIAKAMNPKEYTITVTDKKVKNDTYMIYGDDENGEARAFEVTDSVFKWRFNSSDVYAEIKEGHTYKFQTCGYRLRSISIFSMYPNIYEIEEIAAPQNSVQDSMRGDLT